jgi:hypothetical protein
MARTQAQMSGKSKWPPLLLAEFGTYYGLPEIRFVVNDGISKPKPLTLKKAFDEYAREYALIVGQSVRSKTKLSSAPIPRHAVGEGDIDLGASIFSVSELISSTGFEVVPSDRGAFVKSWNGAVAQYNRHLASKIEHSPESAKVLAFKSRDIATNQEI